MRATSAIVLWLLAAPRYDPGDAAGRYQVKCLYCHSGAVMGQQKRPFSAWRDILERMRRKSPLLISREDARVILRYIESDLGLAVRRRRVAAAPKPPPLATQPPAVVPPPPDEALPPADDAALPVPDEPPLSEAETPLLTASAATSDPEAEALGPQLLEEKCSKCHALGRVFTKVDSLERGLSTIERMRRKTGSGISREDAELLERYLRSQL
jgi:cytochrome c5